MVDNGVSALGWGGVFSYDVHIEPYIPIYSVFFSSECTNLGMFFGVPVRGKKVWSATLKLAVHWRPRIVNETDFHSMFQSDL